MLRAPRSHGDDMTHIPRFFRPGPWRAALLRCCLLGWVGWAAAGRFARDVNRRKLMSSLATPVPMQDFLSSPQSFPAGERPAAHDTHSLAARFLMAMGSLGEASGSGAARSVEGIFTTDQQADSGDRSLPVVSGLVLAASEAGA